MNGIGTVDFDANQFRNLERLAEYLSDILQMSQDTGGARVSFAAAHRIVAHGEIIRGC